ncbi:hypothetical protein BV25DRAFT_1870840 [Artomyces pyxidatus]|uniref:Uncharacterized protein n=1 Tax=Artomyces pyxidatus TaxID=48021 RepID=A0ACB8SZ16_9AGAM|nr:hypothetical protein BV25DRAFT_1870840 [Artomyces pyxidatus]
MSRIVLSALSAPGRASAVRLTPHFLLGAAFVVAGTVLRLRCYRVLGKHFTYRLTLWDGHKLVKRGPYAYVRHPGYSAVLCLDVGSTLVVFGPGSLFREEQWLGSPWGRAFLWVWGLCRGAEVVYVFYRPVLEDRLLKERFGTEWVMWARKTRYRLLPFVY